MQTEMKDLRQCPVCGLPIGLLSRNENYISIGCQKCHLSRSVTIEEWNRAVQLGTPVVQRPRPSTDT
jgi:hypothetical protein